jgi:transposase
LRNYIGVLRPAVHEDLERSKACRCAKTAAACQNLLAEDPSLWTFARVAGVEPTINVAERSVLWRKRSFRFYCEARFRFLDRVLTVVETVRHQDRLVFAFMVNTITAHRAGQPAPQILPAGCTTT